MTAAMTADKLTKAIADMSMDFYQDENKQRVGNFYCNLILKHTGANGV